MAEFSYQQILLSLISGGVGGALVSSILGDFLQKKRIIREQKAQILRDLMATRFISPLDQRAAESINYIPALFARDSKVVEAYSNYHDAIINNGNDRGLKFINMIIQIGKNIGIDIHPTNLARGPIFSYKLQEEEREFNQKLEARNKSEHLSCVSN